MSESRNKQAVREYLRARETCDLQALDRVLTPDFRHEMLGREQDRAGLFEEVASFPFSDQRFHVDALVEEGDQVACRYRLRGTAPSGKSVEFSGMFIAQMSDGRLASGWGEYDAVTALSALRD